MSDLSNALADYLALRRSLGYKLVRGGQVLAEFVDYLEGCGVETVTVEAAVAWATLTPNPESSWRAQRLGFVRGFARYLHVTVDQRHQ
ncbi:MAG: integrase, partial [Actinomycetota bacterium]|nr:integrase [Actinomycetota bacterium]